jgi:paraquat-inducible protein B
MTSSRGESNARLGVFVVSGLVLAAAGVLALGAARIFERTVPLHCYFRETVQGLDPGSPISYRGVQLGRVSRVLMRQVDEKSGMAMGHQAVIEVVCDLDPAQLSRFGGAAPTDREIRDALRREVEQGLRVSVKWKDITGQKFLDVDYFDPETARPPELGFAPAEPYIPTYTEKSLTDIQRDASAVIGSLAKIDYTAIGAKVQLVLDQLAQKLSDLQTDEISRGIRAATQSMDETFRSEELKRAVSRLDTITAELEKAGKRANEILARPDLEQGVTDLAASARSLRATAEEVGKTLPGTIARIDAAVEEARRAVVDAKLPETTAAVRDGVRDVGGAARSVTNVRGDLQAALRDLSDASRAIARFAEFLERNPDALLSGRRTTEGGTR